MTEDEWNELKKIAKVWRLTGRNWAAIKDEVDRCREGLRLAKEWLSAADENHQERLMREAFRAWLEAQNER